MNSCILMAEIVKEPELRYTPDNQTPITEMLVQFAGIKSEDPPATLKVVGWGNLAQEIQQTYHQGDRVVIEGRLSMLTIDRPEGFKEKRAELTASRVYPMGIQEGGETQGQEPTASTNTASTNNVVSLKPRSFATASSETSENQSSQPPQTSRFAATSTPSDPDNPTDLDEIPF